MNSKYLLPDFVQQMLQSGQFDRKEVELFVRCFFSTIERALFDDGVVKVQGLGTFKLLKVEARQSVDVNTGEKIEIKEHSKISFIPDELLKAEVNKPYAHLETVDLPQEEKQVLEKEQDVVTINSTIMNKNEEPVFEVSDTPENTKEQQKPKSKTGTVIAWIVFCLIVVALIGYALFSIGVITCDTTCDTQKKVEQTQVIATPVEQAPQVEVAKEATVSDPQQWETYAIVPLPKGQRLTLLALKYYGNKVFWVYIYEANKENIVNPNDIKAGTKIRIPKAPISVINPKDSESIRKAKELEVKYKAKFARK